MKRAIVYYSLTNNTKATAEIFAEKLEADIYGVDFVTPLPNNKAGQMLEGGRQVVFSVKPEIKGEPKDYSQYDEIIIGSPIWAGKCASPFNTLFENSDFCDKVVAIFTYSGGGDNDGCIKAIKDKLKNLKYNVALADSKTKFASTNDEKIEEFLKNFAR